MTWPLSQSAASKPRSVYVRPCEGGGYEVMLEGGMCDGRSIGFSLDARKANAIAREHHLRALAMHEMAEEAAGRKLTIPKPTLRECEVPQVTGLEVRQFRGVGWTVCSCGSDGNILDRLRTFRTADDADECAKEMFEDAAPGIIEIQGSEPYLKLSKDTGDAS